MDALRSQRKKWKAKKVLAKKKKKEECATMGPSKAPSKCLEAEISRWDEIRGHKEAERLCAR